MLLYLYCLFVRYLLCANTLHVQIYIYNYSPNETIEIQWFDADWLQLLFQRRLG